MRLFITEKPELQRAICEHLGGNFANKGGYFEKGNDVVVSCFGHMLELYDPEDYDQSFEKWNLDQLPFCFAPIKKKPKPETEERLNLIISLIEKADTIVNAGDDDEEGQLLIDEILRYIDNKKPVFRILISAVTPKAVEKAFDNIKPNAEFEHLGYKAEARSIADQVFGYNFTRLFSVLNRNAGGNDLISVGRVQTPILGLVVRRDRVNSAHQKSYYYTISAGFTFPNFPSFNARYLFKDDDPINENGRLESKEFAEIMVSKCKNQKAIVSSLETKERNKSAPLPYNGIKLQQDCARKFGYSLELTAKIADDLRLKHGLITYSRSDSRYLTDEHFAEAPIVLNAIAQTATQLAGDIAKTDTKIKSKAFNSSKVTAHHGIIPTETIGDFSKLTNEEKNIYLLICNQYIAQFFPNYVYDETSVVIDVCDTSGNKIGVQFGGKTKVDKDVGWKSLYANDTDNDEVKDDSDVDLLDLRNLSVGIQGDCINCEFSQKETKPPSLYTLESLAGALSRVANEVKDPNLAKVLKEKDADKPDESGGIGTPATRPAIVKLLFDRGYIVEKNGKIVSTDLGRDFYDLLPDLIKYPDMTAIWFEQQKEIQNMEDVYEFIDMMMADLVEPLISRLKNAKMKVTTYDCPKCGRFMRRIPAKDGKGYWWGCSGYDDKESPCKHSMDDREGKPVERINKPRKMPGFGLKL